MSLRGVYTHKYMYIYTHVATAMHMNKIHERNNREELCRVLHHSFHLFFVITLEVFCVNTHPYTFLSFATFRHYAVPVRHLPLL